MIATAAAEKIGSRQGLISVGIGVLIAQLIMTYMMSIGKGWAQAFFWFTDTKYVLNVFIGVLIMFIAGYFLGKLAGKLIIIKQWNYALTGCLVGIEILLITTFITSWVGFFQEGISQMGTESNPLYDYIVKPMYWVTIFGAIPALLVGVWFGWQIKKKGEGMV